jgi:hypothetical protein
MLLSRRKFILIAGSTAVIVAAGKAAIDLDKMPSTAIAAWSSATSTEPDIRKRLLAYAILAPNPHNMQPWIVLPQTDPCSIFPQGARFKCSCGWDILDKLIPRPVAICKIYCAPNGYDSS